MSGIIFSLLFLLITTCTACAANGAAAPKAPPDARQGEYKEGEVITGFHRGTDDYVVSATAHAINAVIIERLPGFTQPVFLLKLPPNLTVPRAVEKLSTFEEVDFAEPNYIFKTMGK